MFKQAITEDINRRNNKKIEHLLNFPCTKMDNLNKEDSFYILQDKTTKKDCLVLLILTINLNRNSYRSNQVIILKKTNKKTNT